MNTKTENVFVGRQQEIHDFLELLNSDNSVSFVLIGEPGIGKSSFLNALVEQLRNSEKFFVGYYPVLFSADIGNPFVGVLESAM
jgi:AAA+ ATPase superfamily predicted ATPase